MMFGLKSKLGGWLTRWLTKELHEADDALLSDFGRLCYEIRPGDVILVEGRSRISNVIKLITQTPWTHAALYVGRLYDIHDSELQARVREHYDGDPHDQLIIEALLGEGTVVHSISKYRKEHLRICRPKGLSHTDAQKVITYAIARLGTDYDVRQLLDLARFMFPFWALLPRRWRSTLFERNVGQSTRTVCSSMLGEAFSSVHFPVLPFVERTADGKVHLYKRNPRLFTPRDFDHSPYFEIIKYPVFGLDDISVYQRLPWGNVDEYCNGIDDCYLDTTHSHAVQSSESAPPATGPVLGGQPGEKVSDNGDGSPRRRLAPRHQQINLLAALRKGMPSSESDDGAPLPAPDAELTADKERHSA